MNPEAFSESDLETARVLFLQPRVRRILGNQTGSIRSVGIIIPTTPVRNALEHILCEEGWTRVQFTDQRGNETVHPGQQGTLHISKEEP